VEYSEMVEYGVVRSKMKQGLFDLGSKLKQIT